MSDTPALAWHSLAAAEVLASLESSVAGLTTAEVERRHAAFGPNELPVQERVGAARRILRQFHNVLI
jgi:magnesium-transporting ATPase (P-type)